MNNRIIILTVCCLLALILKVPQILAESNEFKTVSAGSGHSLALKADGSLWTCGYNNNGQLGDGTNTDRNELLKVMDEVESIVAGVNHSYVIKTDGSLWGFGWNGTWQLSGGTELSRNEPIKLMDGVQSVAAGGNHTLVVKKDGSLWAWGDNYFGQLGNGTTKDTSSPVRIMDDVALAAAGSAHSLVVKKDGSLWAWGFNVSGQLGDGTRTDSSKPVKIMEGVVFVAAGEEHSLAIKADGSLWVWGCDGHDSTDIRTIPQKIMENVDFAAAGVSNSFAIKTDGSLWAWGFNQNGKLGDGTNTSTGAHGVVIEDNDKNAPVKIMDNVASVAAGHGHSLAVKTDGSLWAWGSYRVTSHGGTDTVSKPVMIDSIGSDTATFLTGATPSASMSNFVKTRVYTPGNIDDVNENEWFGFNQQKVIATAYEYNLMQGNDAATFNPTGNISIAEAITVAARIHSIYMTGTEKFIQGNPWHKVYIEYAIDQGIISATDFSDYNKAAKRAEMAYIFSHTLPEFEFSSQNTINSLPDVNDGIQYSEAVFTLYKAGVLAGNDDQGTFNPDTTIIRAEVAAIISRVILSGARFSGKTF